MKLDKKLTAEIIEKNIQKIFVHFYEAGCSWKKINIEFHDFNIADLVPLDSDYDFQIYVKVEEQALLDAWTITRTQKADHTWNIKTRYIFSSEKVQDRCGCGTSFAFEKKKLKIDLEKLRNLKINFQK